MEEATMIAKGLVGSFWASASFYLTGLVFSVFSTSNEKELYLRSLVAVLGLSTSKIKKGKRRALDNLVFWLNSVVWGILLLTVASTFNPSAANTVALFFLVIWGQSLVIPTVLRTGKPFWKRSFTKNAANAVACLAYAASLSFFHHNFSY